MEENTASRMAQESEERISDATLAYLKRSFSSAKVATGAGSLMTISKRALMVMSLVM